MSTESYYRYTADSGVQYAIREPAWVASFSALLPALPALPRLPKTETTRYYVLSDVFTSSERRLPADLPLQYNLNDLVFYQGAFYRVTRVQQQRGATEKP